MSDHDDPFRQPEPRPEPPVHPEDPATEAYSHGRVDAFTREAYTPPSYSPDPYQAPPSSYTAEPYASPVAPMPSDFVPSEGGAVAAAAPADVPLDGTPVWLNRVGEELVAWFKTLASAAVYATLIVTFGFQVARVEGMSMAPTLQDQDRLIVNKLAYRIGDPKVGDIVMLYYPLKPEKSFVKRVIAEEGDNVRIVDGKVYRNEVLLDDNFVPAEYRSHDDWGPTVIPEGYYFVMGDHRNNSSDSRHWGFVPKKYIIGKVQLRWWPLAHAKVF
jgi:signal peptidase I